MKNTHGGMLLLVKLQAKVTLLHGCFSPFLNCTNATTSRNASHFCKKSLVRSVWQTPNYASSIESRDGSRATVLSKNERFVMIVNCTPLTIIPKRPILDVAAALFIYLFTYLFIYLFICLFIYLSITIFTVGLQC